MALTRLYAMLNPLAAKSLIKDFFLVFECSIKPILTGSSASFFGERRMCESPSFRFVFTALNRISCYRFNAISRVLLEI